MPEKIKLSPEGLPGSDELEETGRGMVSPALLYDDELYMSGLVSRDADREIHGSTTEAQTRKIFENLGIILDSVDRDYDDVLKVVSYFTDVEAQLPVFKEVWLDHFSEPYPVHSAYEISRLAHEDLLLEVEVTVGME